MGTNKERIEQLEARIGVGTQYKARHDREASSCGRNAQPPLRSLARKPGEPQPQQPSSRRQPSPRRQR